MTSMALSLCEIKDEEFDANDYQDKFNKHGMRTGTLGSAVITKTNETRADTSFRDNTQSNSRF